MKRLASVALALYPQAWRERYGDEAWALIEEERVTATTLLDLLRGAADAHLHPGGLRPTALDQMRNTVSATACCWIAFVIAGAGFAKLTEDFPFGNGAAAHGLLETSKATVVGGSGIATAAFVIGGASLVEAVVRQAWRGRNRELARSLLATIIYVAPLGLLMTMYVWLAHEPVASHAPGTWILFTVWAATGVAAALAGGLGARAALRCTRLRATELRPGVRGAAVVVLSMAAMTIATAAYAIALVIDAPALAASPSTPFALNTALLLALDAMLMSVVTGLAIVTSWRGVRAARAL